MSDPRRHVVVATDEAFVIPTATALRSISAHDHGPLAVWVLSSAVSPAHMRGIERSLHDADIEIRWIDMDDVDLGDTSRSPIGRATFMRLAIGDVLPAEVDSVLYLDGDILVNTSLSPLWEQDAGDAVLQAVRSVNYPALCTYGAADHWPELGADPRAPYFNAGVLMIDLQRWRHLDVGRRALDFLASPHANGTLADQEALNMVLSGKWHQLDPMWNQQTPFLDDCRGVHLLYDDDVIQRARTNPAIIHFSSRPKPWHVACTHPATAQWRRVASETAFAPVELDRDSVLRTARSRLKRAASVLIKG